MSQIDRGSQSVDRGSPVDRSTEDRTAARAVVSHHADLAAGLERRAESLLQLVEAGSRREAEVVRQDLLGYLRTELLPHAHAEEDTLYPAAAARPGGGPLVDGMVREHRAIVALVAEVTATPSPVRAAAAARALTALFAAHLVKENELILPILMASGDGKLADLLAGMHDLLGADGAAHHHHKAPDALGGLAEDSPAEDAPAGGTGCGCGGACGGGGGGAATGDAPVLTLDARLDVRDIPHAQRHATVLSTVGALAPGQAVVLIAPHAPRPVLAEIESRFSGQIATDWLQSGPEVWQIRLERLGA